MAIAGSSLSSLAPLSKVGTEYSGTASIIWARIMRGAFQLRPHQYP